MPKQQPQWQPLSKLPSLATHIDGWLQAAQDQYETLLPAKARPSSLDDYTVNRVIKVATSQQNDLWLFDEQLSRWSKASLPMQERQEIERLQGQMKMLREQIKAILELANDLSHDTIERVMAKSDAELGLSFLLNPDTFRNS
jgi:hypothetical protein